MDIWDWLTSIELIMEEIDKIKKEIEDIKQRLKEYEEVFIALFGLANYNVAKTIYKKKD
jgi:hypothetical protein